MLEGFEENDWDPSNGDNVNRDRRAGHGRLSTGTRGVAGNRCRPRHPDRGRL